MQDNVFYAIAADAMLLAHTLVAGFIVLGLVAIIAGGLRSWRWVRNAWFRWAHITAIAIVVLQSWLGVICPLTTWEMALREKAGQATYTGSFVAHWLESLLYYQAPAWVFIVGYTLFGGAVVATWYWVRPDPLRQRRPRS